MPEILISIRQLLNLMGLQGPSCFVCGAMHDDAIDAGLAAAFVIGMQQYHWGRGETPIQECLPFLSPEARELLVTGIAGQCWNRAIGRDSE